MSIVPMHHIILISVTRDVCCCHNMEEEFEDTKRTTNDLQNTHKTKDRVTQIPLKTGDELKCSGRVQNHIGWYPLELWVFIVQLYILSVSFNGSHQNIRGKTQTCH